MLYVWYPCRSGRMPRMHRHNVQKCFSSLATEKLKGKSLEEAKKIQNTDIVEELSLPPVKIHCSVLAEDAIKAAISDYQEKQE